MPTYRVTDPTTGKTVRLTGDSPPSDAELEEIFSGLNKAPPLSDSAQVEQPKPPVSMSESFFPNRAAAVKSKAPFPAKQVGSIIDLLRMGPKAAFAGAKTARGMGSFKENMARGPSSVSEAIITDPASVTAFIPGSTLPRLLIQGGASSAIHQGEKAAKGEGASLGEAGAETLVNLLVPKGLQTFGGALKKTGAGIMQSILKPTKAAKMAGFEPEQVFREGVASAVPFRGGVRGMQKRLEDIRKDASKGFGEVLKSKPDATVFFPGNVRLTKAQLEREMREEGKNLAPEIRSGIAKAFKGWKETAEIASPEGKSISARKAKNIQQDVGRAGEFRPEVDTRDIEGEARFANKLYGNMAGEFDKKIPELAPFNRILSSTRPADIALRQAAERISNNYGISLTDAIILAGMAGATTTGGVFGGKEGAGAGASAGLSLFALNRLKRNPTFATQLFKSGEFLQDPTSESLKRALQRISSQGFRD